MNLIERLISFLRAKPFVFTLRPNIHNTWVFSVDGSGQLDIVEHLIGDADLYGISENLIRTGTRGQTLTGYWFLTHIN